MVLVQGRGLREICELLLQLSLMSFLAFRISSVRSLIPGYAAGIQDFSRIFLPPSNWWSRESNWVVAQSCWHFDLWGLRLTAGRLPRNNVHATVVGKDWAVQRHGMCMLKRGLSIWTYGSLQRFVVRVNDQQESTLADTPAPTRGHESPCWVLHATKSATAPGVTVGTIVLKWWIVVMLVVLLDTALVEISGKVYTLVN